MCFINAKLRLKASLGGGTLGNGASSMPLLGDEGSWPGGVTFGMADARAVSKFIGFPQMISKMI